MFVQIIEGRVSDAQAVKAAVENWVDKVSPCVEGWLGSTAGVTDDGIAVLIARFESRANARHNSALPEVNLWWEETEKLFDGVPILRHSDDVVADIVGDLGTAEFVQVIHGAATKADKFRSMASANSAEWAAFRPEILGSVATLHEGTEYTMVLYFTNEADALDGELREIPPQLRSHMDAMNKIEVGTPTFRNLKQPLLNVAV